MRLAFGSDHAGFELKRYLLEFARDQGHQTVDLGPETADRVDYPDFAYLVAERVSSGDCERGVLCCGSGIGMSMTANRVRGVRAVVCMHEIQARLSREHNDANVLCLGERLIGRSLAEAIFSQFMESSFLEGRHSGRVAKIDRPQD